MLGVGTEALGRAPGEEDLENGLDEVGVQAERDVDEAEGSLLFLC